MRQQLFGAVLIGGFQVKFQISAEIGKACDILLKFALFSVIQLRIVGCGNAAEIRPGQRGKRAVRNPSASAPEAGEKPFPGISRLEECPLPRLRNSMRPRGGKSSWPHAVSGGFPQIFLFFEELCDLPRLNPV